jgi:superfamily II DNA or RNA helicase
MLVADECHRYGAPANRRAIEGDWVASLGLSATPTREYDTWFEDYVVPETGPIFFEYGYDQALHDGVLTPFQLTNYEVPLTAREQARVDTASRRIAQLLEDGGVADDDQLKRALLARARLLQAAKARLPAARALMHTRKGRRAIVFHEQIAAAEEVLGMLVEDGHRAVAYHSALAAPTRQKNLLLFRQGQVDVLVTCRALDEGLDVPDAEFGLICASTASTRQRIQRLGRLVRRAEGKDVAEIATIYAGKPERSRLEEEEATLSGVAGVRWFEVRFE